MKITWGNPNIRVHLFSSGFIMFRTVLWYSRDMGFIGIPDIFCRVLQEFARGFRGSGWDKG